MLLNERKRNPVKFNPWLSANRLSNNWSIKCFVGIAFNAFFVYQSEQKDMHVFENN